MIISDLNQLEVVEGASVVGGFFNPGGFSTGISISVNGSVTGYVAQSSGTATAVGAGAAVEEEHNSSVNANTGTASASGSSTSVATGRTSYPHPW